jgi:hypothetical protein
MEPNHITPSKPVPHRASDGPASMRAEAVRGGQLLLDFLGKDVLSFWHPFCSARSTLCLSVGALSSSVKHRGEIV